MDKTATQVRTRTRGVDIDALRKRLRRAGYRDFPETPEKLDEFAFAQGILLPWEFVTTRKSHAAKTTGATV